MTRPRPAGPPTGRPLLNKPPRATIWLIGITAAAHLLVTLMPDHVAGEAIVGLALIPAVLFGVVQVGPDFGLVPAWMTPLTTLFLHGDWTHLLANMVFLLMFGGLAEMALRPARLALLYFVCGYIANLAEAAWQPDLQAPVIGASGATSALFGAHLMLCLVAARQGGPARDTLLRQAGFLAGLWVLMQLFSVFYSGYNVAWVAHVAGLLSGFILVVPFLPRAVRPAVSAVGQAQPSRSADGRQAGSSVDPQGMADFQAPSREDETEQEASPTGDHAPDTPDATTANQSRSRRTSRSRIPTSY